MKGQTMTRSTAIIFGLMLSVILLVGYSYIKHSDKLAQGGFSAMISAGLSDFSGLFQGNFMLAIILFLMGVAIGYFLGKASW